MNELDADRLQALQKAIVDHVEAVNSTAVPCVYVVAGSYLHGTAGPESDLDIRGFHCVPAEHHLYIGNPDERIEGTWEADGANSPTVEVTSHELRAFGRQLATQNLNLIEAVLCGQSVNATPPGYFRDLQELLIEQFRDGLPTQYAEMARGLIPSGVSVERTDSLSVNELLYAFRGVLAAVHLQQEHRFQVDLPTLSDALLSPQERAIVQEIITQKHDQVDTLDPSVTTQAVSIINNYLRQVNANISIDDSKAQAEINKWMIHTREETSTFISS